MVENQQPQPMTEDEFVESLISKFQRSKYELEISRVNRIQTHREAIELAYSWGGIAVGYMGSGRVSACLIERLMRKLTEKVETL